MSTIPAHDRGEFTYCRRCRGYRLRRHARTGEAVPGSPAQSAKPACRSRRLGEAFGFGHRFLDGADHVESGLGKVVILTFAQTLEGFDRVFELDLNAGRAGEHRRHVEWLRQEALDLAGAGNGELVLFGKLVHAENG